MTVIFLLLCSGVEFSSFGEQFSSHFLSVPYLCLHLAFGWEISLSAPLTLLFVLFAEVFEVQVLVFLTHLLSGSRPWSIPAGAAQSQSSGARPWAQERDPFPDGFACEHKEGALRAQEPEEG